MRNTTLYNSDCIKAMKKLDENTVDFILTDPPYHLTSIVNRFGKENSKAPKGNTDGSFNRLSKGFMGKTWDGGDIAFNVEMWKECYRILQTGGYMAVFGGTRTFHLMAKAIQEAGFEIETIIAWNYNSGFPKALNIAIQIDKKLKVESEKIGKGKSGKTALMDKFKGKESYGEYETFKASSDIGKKFEGYKSALKPAFEPIIICKKGNKHINNKLQDKNYVSFLNVSKASKKDRNICIDYTVLDSLNNHATVKPIEILKKVFELAVEKNKDMVVLDCFAGSGSTGVAIEHYNKENNTKHKSILIEMEKEHCEIIDKRCLLGGEYYVL